MTAADPLDELAFVLHGQGYCGEVCVCVDDARALLPVVDEIAGKRAAEELRAAADWMRRNHYNGPSRHLRNRAAALAALDANPTPEPVAHNHTRFRNDAGPWSPCPVSCPAAGLLR